jgi:pyruvate/2-oxoglutarate dehydrogenase complex dihydrolipoamide acyltransferase (E2) component
MVEVTVPSLGQSGMDIKVEKWFVEEGGHTVKSEPLYELSNEKLTQEIESPATGTLTKIFVKTGETAPIGKVLATIE